MERLAVDTSEVGERVVLRLRGELDAGSAPRLRQRLVEVTTAKSPHVVVDLDGVEFVDEFGLGALLGGAMRARGRGGDLSVVCSRPDVLDVLRLSGFDRAVAVVADPQDPGA